MSTISSSGPAGIGQKPMANSVPVTVASDQTAISVTQTSVAQSTTMGSITANGQTVTHSPLAAQGGLTLQITGTWVGQIDFQVTIDDTNWSARSLHDGNNAVNATTGNGNFRVSTGPILRFRVISTSWSSGTASINIRSGVESITTITQALPSGTNVIGGVTASGTFPISAASLPLPTGAATSALQTQPGVDIGDVTINNAAGAAAVNIQDGGNSITVDGAVSFSALPFSTRSDTFTATGNGVTVDRTTSPLDAYAVQVKGTGAAATTWDVRLEGSLDGTNFSQILQHTTTTGDGAVVWIGASTAPSLYFRSRVAGLVLGSATNIVVTILGKA